MKKKRIVKIMGNVTQSIAKKWYLDEQTDKIILQEAGLFKHIAPHAEQYESIESLNYTMEHMEDVIKNPDFVFYNTKKNGIEYYKKLIENVVVVVTPTRKRELYISSVYPVDESKISNRKIRELSEIKKAKKKMEKEMIQKYSKEKQTSNH